MQSKTKIGMLIMQKMNNTSNTNQNIKNNPQSSISIVADNQPKQINNQNTNTKNNVQKVLSYHQLAHYNAFTLTYNGQQSKKQPAIALQRTFSNISNLPSQYCQLQKQNYRLIESNYNLLHKFTGLVQMIRNQLLKIIQHIQQYYYVVAIQTLYGLIDKIKNFQSTSTKNIEQSSRFYGISQSVNQKRDRGKFDDQNMVKQFRNSLNSQTNKNVTRQSIKQFKPTMREDSIVSEYDMINSIANQQPIEIRKKVMQIVIGASQITHIPQLTQQRPPQRQNNILDFAQQNAQTPDFTHIGQMSRGYHSNADPYDIRHSFQALRPESMYNIEKKMGVDEMKEHQSSEILDQIEYKQSRLRPVSQKNLKILINNGRRKPLQEQNDKSDEMFRFLLTQAQTIQIMLAN